MPPPRLDGWRLDGGRPAQAYAPMSQTPETPQDGGRDAARRKLFSRAMVVGFVLLLAVYALVTFLGRR